MDDIPETDADALLTHATFVKGVARGILGRDSRVDDAVQETWLAAIRKHPEQRPGVRGWLARAAQNVAWSFRRGDAARKRREESSRPPTRLPSPDEIVAREEERRRMLAAVLKLDEPYRSAVLYRYYEDLPPREIGRLLGVPTETARTRVKRGLEQLRKRLLSEHGGNGRLLLLALLPLAGLDRGALSAAATATTGTAATGVAIMSAKMKVATIAVLALLFAGGIALRQFGGNGPTLAPDRPSGEQLHREPVDRESTRNSLLPVVRESGDPSVEPPGENSGTTTTGAGAAGTTGSSRDNRGTRSENPGEVRGAVVSDDANIPVDGAKITLKYDYTASGGRWPKGGIRELTLVTDAAGEFRYEKVEAGAYEIRIEHDDYAPRVLSGVRVESGAGLEGLSIRMISDLRKVGTVTGTVLDAFGSPVAAAQVVVHSMGDGGKSTAETDIDGAYRVERLLPGFYSVSLTKAPPEGEAARLWQRTLRAEVLPGQVTHVDFEGSGTLTGVVLDADEKPIAKAMVVLQAVERTEKTATRRVNAGEDGTFRIEDAGIGLHRVTVGGGADGWSAVEAMTVDLGGSDQEVRIRLEAGEIAGTLLLEDGKAPRTRGLFPNIMIFPAEFKGEPKDYRHVASGTPDHLGAWRIRGLAAGKYRFRVFLTGYQCPERDLEIGWGEIKEGVELKAKLLVHGTLSVKVVDERGDPVEGVVLNYGVKGQSGRGVRASQPEPGRYLSTTVEVGSWSLMLIRPGLQTKHVPIVVKEGETTSLTVTMEPKLPR